MARAHVDDPQWVDDRQWPATGMCFELVIDDKSFGTFSGVKGLIAEIEVTEWPEGGENGFVHRMPGRVKYKDVTLTRNTNKQSAAIVGWIEETRLTHKVYTAAIVAYDAKMSPVATWSLVGVWPMRYTGPVLDTNVGAMAKETLDLAHSGFTVTGS